MENSPHKCTNESSEEHLQKQINFQGHKMLCAQLIELDASAIEKIAELSHLEEIGSSLEFDELKVHVNRKFLKRQEGNDPLTGKALKAISSEELLDCIDGKRIVLLSDARGKGKTTELRLLAKQVKDKYPSYWVVFIDLTDHIEAFDNGTEFESSTDVIQFASDKILKIRGLEAEVFSHLFKKGHVVVMMDAFDEIRPTAKSVVVKLTNAIKEKSENRVFIATRPQAEENEKLDAEIFSLKPLTHHDQEKFARDLLSGGSAEGEILEAKVREVASFQFHLNSYRSNQINDPIIFRLLMEAFENINDFKAQQSDWFPLYSRFVNKMTDRFVKKSKVSSDEVFAFHHKIALTSIFEKPDSKEKVANLFQNFDSPQTPRMTKVGFTSSNGADETKFLDLTLGEFFAADFFYKNLFLINEQADKSIAELFQLIWEENTSYRCRMITKFLDSIFETSTAEDLDKFGAVFARLLSEKELLEVFRLGVFDDCANLMRMISLIFKDQKETLFEMWSVRRFGTNALMMAVEGRSIPFIEKLMVTAHEVLDPKHFKELFLGQSNIGKPNIYFAAASSFDEGVASYLITHRLNPLSDEESKALLMSRDGQSVNILMQSCEMTTDLRELKTIFEVMKEKCSKEELKSMMSEVISGQTLFSRAFTGIQRVEPLEWLIQCYKERFSHEELQGIFLNVRALEEAKYALIHVAIKWTAAILEIFFNFLEEIFPEKDERKKILIINFLNEPTMFHYATENADAEAFTLIKTKFAELLSVEEMKAMILVEDMNIFSIAIQGYDNEKTIEALWRYMQEFIDAPSLKQILLKKEWGDKKWPELFWQSEQRFKDVVAIFDSFVDEHFSEDEARDFREIPPPEKRVNPLDRFWS